MSRTAARKALPQPLHVTPALFDRWRAARTEPAATPVGYTPIAQLFEDFCAWAEVAENIVDEIDKASFSAAFVGAPKPLILFETMQCRMYWRHPRMAKCASLRLRDPIETSRVFMRGPH